MRVQNILRNYLRRTTPEQGTIKRKAHAATMAACAMIVPSLCAIYFWHAGIKEEEPYWVWASMMLWRAHAVVAVVALLLWLFEAPKPTQFLPVKNGAVLEALGKIHPGFPLIGMTVIFIFFGWLTVSRFELAYDSWRWGNTGRALGHIVKGLLLLLLTVAAGLGPVAIAIMRFRKFISGEPKA